MSTVIEKINKNKIKLIDKQEKVINSNWEIYWGEKNKTEFQKRLLMVGNADQKEMNHK